MELDSSFPQEFRHTQAGIPEDISCNRVNSPEKSLEASPGIDERPKYLHTVKDIEAYAATVFRAANDTKIRLENDLKGRITKLDLTPESEAKLLEISEKTSKACANLIAEKHAQNQSALTGIFGNTIEIAHGTNNLMFQAVKKRIHSDVADMMNQIKHFHDNIQEQIEGSQVPMETKIVVPSLLNKLWNKLNYFQSGPTEKGIALNSIYSLFNSIRMQNNLDHDLWKNGWSSEPLPFENRPAMISAFEPAFNANGAYTSAAPRNRLLENAVLPNFFRTTFKAVEKSTIPSVIPEFDATRSASPFESGLSDAKSRLDTTKLLVKQALTYHAKSYIAKQQSLGLEVSPNQTIPFQWVALLTDSWMVQKLANLGIKSRIDNESEMLDMTIKALESFHDQDLEIDGNNVKFDIMIWNAPCHALQDTLSIISSSSGAIENYCNSKARASMKKAVESKIESLNSSLYAIQVSPNLKNEIECLAALKHAIKDPSKSRVEWQQHANKLAALTCHLNRSKLNAEDAAYLKLIEERECIRDLQIDIEAIFDKNLSSNLVELDYNHHALSARLLNMGSLLGFAQHFGCRSGKDRSAFADIESKLFTLATERLGRCPTYWEQEHLPFIQSDRKVITEKSGNIDVIAEANIGANLGLNSSNNHNLPVPKEKFDAQKFDDQRRKVTGASAALFERAIR